MWPLSTKKTSPRKVKTKLRKGRSISLGRALERTNSNLLVSYPMKRTPLKKASIMTKRKRKKKKIRLRSNNLKLPVKHQCTQINRICPGINRPRRSTLKIPVRHQVTQINRICPGTKVWTSLQEQSNNLSSSPYIPKSTWCKYKTRTPRIPQR